MKLLLVPSPEGIFFSAAHRHSATALRKNVVRATVADRGGGRLRRNARAGSRHGARSARRPDHGADPGRSGSNLPRNGWQARAHRLHVERHPRRGCSGRSTPSIRGGARSCRCGTGCDQAPRRRPSSRPWQAAQSVMTFSGVSGPPSAGPTSRWAWRVPGAAAFDARAVPGRYGGAELPPRRRPVRIGPVPDAGADAAAGTSRESAAVEARF